jgi:MoaA/NifB/PqqE/SkfB family radical SAM enzyme
LWKTLEKCDSDRYYLNKDEYEILFEELENMKIFTLVISGGEPFIRKDILKIISLAKKHRLKLYITTNGTVLTKKMIKSLVNFKVDDILFSLDSPFPDVHDFIRGKKGTFNKTVKSIRELEKEKVRRKSRYPRILVNSVITKYNISNLLDISCKFWDLKIDLFSFYYPTNISESSLEEVHKLFGRNFYSGQFYDLKILPKKKKLIDFLNSLKNIKKKNVLVKLPTFSNFFSFCLYPWIATTISPYGDVYPCTIFDKLKIGSIREKSLREIWNNKKYRKLRKLFLKQKLGVCNECTCGINIKDIINRSPFFLR